MLSVMPREMLTISGYEGLPVLLCGGGQGEVMDNRNDLFQGEEVERQL